MRCQKAIFSAYRTDQYADPEGFLHQLGAVLEEFPDEVITHVSDPRTGVQRRSEWPPTIAKIVAACEDHAAYLDRMRKPRAVPLPRLPSPRLQDMPAGYLAQIFVPENHSRYQALVRWSETADRLYWKYGKSSDGRQGIWVNIGIWDGSISMHSDTETIMATERTNPEQTVRE